MNGKDRIVFFNRGNAYLDIGEYSKAMADFKEALDLFPESPLYMFHLAYAQLKSA